MASSVNLRYNGPQSRVVALDRDVEDGDIIAVDKEMASDLLAAHGFTETKSKPRSAAEDRAAKAEAEAAKAAEASAEDGGGQ